MYPKVSMKGLYMLKIHWLWTGLLIGMLLFASNVDAKKTSSHLFSKSTMRRLETQFLRRTKGLKRHVLRLGLKAFRCAWRRKIRKPLLTIIDYSLPSSKKRLWVLHLRTKRVLFYEYVSHGKNTGLLWARRFSNRNQSRQSSLGLFVTADTYRGRNGFSLRLDGLDKGFNHNARRRAIVMHGAWYVSRKFLQKHRRLGRSWGCPAVRTRIHKRLLNRIKRGSGLFIYYPHSKWLRSSRWLRCR